MREVDIAGLHALELGDPKARRLVFLHGFPDHPPTARTFIAELVARGHTVLAPWLPGYVPSKQLDRYDPRSVATALRSVIDAWSPDEPVDLVGHDWGAILTYTLCLTAPDRIHRAVTLSVPHLRTFARALRRPAQLRASWYMALFQLPGSTRVVRANDLALVDRLWRTWSPGLHLASADRAELHACLAASLPAPLEYYRDTRRDSASLLRFFKQPITTPLLYLHGADDGCIVPPREDDHRYFSGGYERETLAGLGHFLHIEDPDAVATRIAAWLAR